MNKWDSLQFQLCILPPIWYDFCWYNSPLHHCLTNLGQIQIVWLRLIEVAWCSGDMGTRGTWATAKCTFCARGKEIIFTILTKFRLFWDWLVTPSPGAVWSLWLRWGYLQPYIFHTKVWILACALSGAVTVHVSAYFNMTEPPCPLSVLLFSPCCCTCQHMARF